MANPLLWGEGQASGKVFAVVELEPLVKDRPRAGGSWSGIEDQEPGARREADHAGDPRGGVVTTMIAVPNRLRLLGDALAAISSRSEDSPDGAVEDDIVAGIKMCHDCGSVLGVERCCDEHPNLVCAACGERRHPDEAAS